MDLFDLKVRFREWRKEARAPLLCLLFVGLMVLLAYSPEGGRAWRTLAALSTITIPLAIAFVLDQVDRAREEQEKRECDDLLRKIREGGGTVEDSAEKIDEAAIRDFITSPLTDSPQAPNRKDIIDQRSSS